MSRRVLILGGTIDARVIAEVLAREDGFTPILSLAGVTMNARSTRTPVETRRGGFGGAEAMVLYIKENGIDAVIDATHPFAAQISANAAAACDAAKVARLVFMRPPWPVAPPDVVEYPDWEALIAAIPQDRNTHVFLAAGHEGLEAFTKTTGLRITARVMELPPIGSLPRGAQLIKSRPARTWQAEADMLSARGITHLVAKNSGHSGSAAKLTAARGLGIPALLLARPAPPPMPIYDDMKTLLAALMGTGLE